MCERVSMYRTFDTHHTATQNIVRMRLRTWSYWSVNSCATVSSSSSTSSKSDFTNESSTPFTMDYLYYVNLLLRVVFSSFVSCEFSVIISSSPNLTSISLSWFFRISTRVGITLTWYTLSTIFSLAGWSMFYISLMKRIIKTWVKFVGCLRKLLMYFIRQS